MNLTLPIYMALFLLSFVLTLFIKNYANKKLYLDIPNDRSSHTIQTPHGGGIAIAITWFIGISYLFFTDNINTSLYFALMIGTIISAISYLDDLFELSVKFRLVTQSLVAILGLYFLGGLKSIDLMLFSIENQIFTNIFAILMIIWFINLYNFLDGIDGYAGSEAVFLAISAFVLFGGEHFLFLIASVLGFLFWNWHKAKIFMGDVGSTLLGYNIAIFAIYYQNKDTSILVWFILFSLFWFDATLTLYRRYTNKETLSQAHRKHAYQRLTQIGWGHSKVVVYSMVINTILFLFAWMAKENPSLQLILFGISVIFMYIIVRFIDREKAFSEG